MNADRPQMNAVTAMNAMSGQVIASAFAVSSKLGIGFLEKVYENALAIELRKRGLSFEQQRSLLVRYEGEIVGEYVPDLLVEDSIVVEIKSVPGLDRRHRLQCLNYLRATGKPLALLLNFGRARLEVARIIFSSP